MQIIKYLFLLACLSLGSGLVAQDYIEVTAERGDGVISLLRRFQLERHQCNIDQFYTLNGLRANKGLYVGKSYKLPLQRYAFNGKTIRASVGITDYALALAIQHYNEGLLAARLRAEDFRQDKLLLVPYYLINCPNELSIYGKKLLAPAEAAAQLGESQVQVNPIELQEQTTTSGHRTFDIFGPALAKTPLLDDKLAGQIFYICAGHGGPDPGAVGKRSGHQLCEDEYAYDVALRFCRNIIQHGGTAYMISRDPNDGIRDGNWLDCDQDEVLWGGVPMVRGQKERLTQRSDIVNALYQENLAKGLTQQTMVCFHVDSRSSKKRIDLFFYYHDTDFVGKARANRMQEVIRSKYAIYQKGREYQGTVTHRDLHMLRETLPSGVYIELANITNSADQKRIVSDRNRQLLADWLYEGLY
ncbi:cell wall hydrolase [Lewinellaceae bacterium SD302]|nr:cell wall hydrolase [Lewinellaceae bacterium SD302]